MKTEEKKEPDLDGEVNVGTPMLKARVTPSPVPSTKPKPQVEEPALELEDDYDDDFDSHATPTASRGSAMNI